MNGPRLENISPELKTVLPNAVPQCRDIEGYIDPTEPLRDEGPFGDHTGPSEVRSVKCELFQGVSFLSGFHSTFRIPRSPFGNPVFHVTAITHRKYAVYPATVVGIPPMEDFYIGGAALTRPAATHSHPMGEGLGVRG